MVAITCMLVIANVQSAINQDIPITSYVKVNFWMELSYKGLASESYLTTFEVWSFTYFINLNILNSRILYLQRKRTLATNSNLLILKSFQPGEYVL